MQGMTIRMPGAGRAELVGFVDETPLAADEIAGRALASAVSPGTELAAGFLADAGAERSGYALVFAVEQAGSATGFAPGDLALAMLPHASRVRCRAGQAWRVPPGLDPADAALARLAAVSWSTLTTTAARPPGRVAVSGLGIVGNLAAQIFAAAGYRVLACDPVAGRRELLADRGIATCDRLPPADAAGSPRIDLVVECSGHEEAVADACRLVRPGGEVALVGVPWSRRSELAAFDLLHLVFHRYVRLRSGWEWEVPGEAAGFAAGSRRENLAAAMAWLAAGRLSGAGLYRRADPRDCQRVYRDLQARSGLLTAVFDWTLLEDG